jgi:hypothetical protein
MDYIAKLHSKNALKERFLARVTALLVARYRYEPAAAGDRAANILAALSMDRDVPPARISWADLFDMLTPSDVLTGIPDVLPRSYAAKEIFATWIAETAESNFAAISRMWFALAVPTLEATGWMRDRGYMEVHP